MKITAVSVFLLSATDVSAFNPAGISKNVFQRNNIKGLQGLMDDNIVDSIERSTAYLPGQAKAELAERFGELAGKEIKTTSAAFAEFTDKLGSPINALYKSAVTDLVGTTHLITVTARFKRDAIWSLGLMTTLDLVLGNYPEKDIATKIKSSLIECVDMDQAEIEAEAESVLSWAAGKSADEIKAALSGEGDSIVASVGKAAKAEKYWMYSKWFGIGLVKLMEIAGVEQDKESCYPVMEEWMGVLEKPSFTACNDSDQYFKTKQKLDMLSTLMKEVEIREKKRLAQRLEEKAEAALARAERDAKFSEEEEKEKAKITASAEAETVPSE